ncbi:MAG: HAD family phosphatase [Melioribacteraceae bacterium]|nr:HAD family phosphatase [Melioribacteraceae bacterium]
MLLERKYSVIVFDLGRVLIPFDYGITRKKMNGVSEGLGDKFVDRYETNYDLHRKFEKNDLSVDEFLDIMIEWTENKLTREEFCKLYSELFWENTDVTALIPKLKEKYKIVLLSNTNEIHKEYGWKNYEFLKYFDKLVLSHEVGAYKPEAKMYESVMEFTQLPPEEHIFIDDVAEYAEGARKMGWDAIHFVGYENLVEEFEKRKIL